MPAPTNGLVLFYNMYDLRNGKMRDLSGSANEGTLTGTVQATGGQVNGHTRSDGVDDRCTASFTPVAGVGGSLGSYTIAFWCKPKREASELGVSMDALGINYIGYSIVTARRWRLSHSNAGSGNVVESGVDDATGIYKHVTAVWTGQTAYLFVNGVTRASASIGGSTTTWNGWKMFGFGVASNNLLGEIDEMRVYNRPLSKASVIEIRDDTTEYPLAGNGGGGDWGSWRTFPALDVAFKFPVRRGG